jgi:magnesium transporter
MLDLADAGELCVIKRDFPVGERPHHFLQDKVPLLKKILATPEDHGVLKAMIKGMPPSEVAYLIHYLDAPSRQIFIRLLKHDFDPEIVLFLEQDLRSDLIALLSGAEVVSILNVLESDDALTLLASLESSQKAVVLSAMSEPQRKRFVDGLAYPESSAGRLMQQEMVTFSQDWTLQESLDYVAGLDHVPHTLYEAFVVNSDAHPVGVVPLVQLIRGPRKSQVLDIMATDFRTIPAQWDQEEVALTFRLYDLMSAPVVDGAGRLIGVITADDVIDVIERKATEDLLHMGRIHSSDFYRSAIKTSLARIHWLIITLLNTLLTSMVINEFQETLQNQVALTVLMPVAAAMGGNSGIQASTIVIRALATKELTSVNMWRSFFKEVRVSLLNGAVFGLTLALVGYFWFDDYRFSIILGGAVLFNMIWAGAAGTTIPVMISHFGYDPALSAGPLLTTTTDVIGYVLFLGLAKLFIG